MQKQLDFVNSENNKLAGMHKENMNMSETYKSNTESMKRLNKNLINKEDEVARLKHTVDSKSEQIKRLTEQYNTSQKPALYGTIGGGGGAEGQKESNNNNIELQKLRDRLAAYQKLESQYNSDK